MRGMSIITCTVLIAGSVAAQQLEVNSPAANMTRAGVNPTIGCNFQVNANSGTCDMRIGGAAGMPFILVAGDLDFSTPIPFTTPTEYVDLDLTTYLIVGDGFGGGTSGIPPELCVLNGAGQFNLAFSANPGLAGATVAFQSVVYDPTFPPLNINLTAAVAYDFFVFVPGVPATIGTQINATLTGDDLTQLVSMGTGYQLYGSARTQMVIDTNGHVRFAGAGLAFDRTETAAEMIAGTPGANATGPIISANWDDHVTDVKVYEDVPTKTLQIRWENGNYFASSAANAWGIMVCTITETLGVCTVVFDYSGYGAINVPSQGLIGISDGSLATLPNQQAELVINGCVIPYTAPNDFSTYFQIFAATSAGNPPIQPIDISGEIITFQDISATGTGQWTVF